MSSLNSLHVCKSSSFAIKSHCSLNWTHNRYISDLITTWQIFAWVHSKLPKLNWKTFASDVKRYFRWWSVCAVADLWRHEHQNENATAMFQFKFARLRSILLNVCSTTGSYITQYPFACTRTPFWPHEATRICLQTLNYFSIRMNWIRNQIWSKFRKMFFFSFEIR